MSNPQIVLSVEHIETGLGHGDASITLLLTKGQTAANCVPFVTGHGKTSNAANSRASWYQDVYFSGNDIVILRNHTDGHLFIDVYVVEFNPAHVTVQQDSFTMPKDGNVFQTTNETITAVDLAKTWVVVHYSSHTSDQYHRRNEAMHRLTSTTNLEFTRYIQNNVNINGHYYVIESDYFDVQQIELTRPSGDTDVNTTISGVADREKTAIFGSSMRVNIAGAEEQYWDNISNEIYLDDSETLRIQTGRADSGDVDFTTYVVELNYEPVVSGTYPDKHVQHNQIVMSNSSLETYTTLAETVGDLNYATPICSSAHQYMRCVDNNKGGSNAARFYHKTRLVNQGTQIETQRIQASDNNAYTRMQTVQWWYEEPAEAPDVESGQVVESIQVVEVTIPHGGGNTSATVALTEGQDTSMCVPFITQADNQYNVGGYAANRYLDIYFSGSNIVFEKTNDAGPNYIICYVVEFNPAIVNVQSGSFSMIDNDADILQTTNTTIISVNTARAFPVVHYNVTNVNSQYLSRREVMSRFTSNVNLEHTRYTGVAADITGHWYVVESIGDHLAVQQAVVTHALQGGQAKTINIDEVDQTRTFIVSSCRGDGRGAAEDTYHDNAMCEVYLASDTTLTIDRYQDDVKMDYCCHVITLNYNYSSSIVAQDDMVQHGRMVWASGENTKSVDVVVLQQYYAMLVHPHPKIGFRVTFSNQSGSNTTAGSANMTIDSATQISAYRDRNNFTSYSRWQLINWYVNINEPEEQDEDQPVKVATIPLTASPNEDYKFDIKNIILEDGSEMDVLFVHGQIFATTINVTDPPNWVELDTFTDESFDYLNKNSAAGPHVTKIIDEGGTPRALVLNQGENNLQCCSSFGISMAGTGSQGAEVVGYVSPVCENSSLTFLGGDAAASISYTPSTGLIVLNLKAGACGYAYFKVTDNNTCCTYSTNHAVIVPTHGAWCAAGGCSWGALCNGPWCWEEVTIGLYKEKWFGGSGQFCGDYCSIYCTNPGDYCPCCGGAYYGYRVPSDYQTPECNYTIFSIGISCWSAGCTCEADEYCN